MKEFYYYGRDTMKRPVVTVCLLTGVDKSGFTEVYSRGVAVCSPLDIPCKKKGRVLAKGRAVKAIKNHGTSEPIKRIEPTKVMWEAGISEKYIDMKSESLPNLTPFELKIIESFEGRN